MRLGLAASLLAGVATYLVVAGAVARLSVWDFLPLHLCDLAIFVAAFALLTRHPLAHEVLWYWGLTWSLPAMIAPDVAAGFPDWRWLAYFGLHGLVVVSALTSIFGFGVRPRRGSALRVFGLTVAYAAIVAVIDVATGANFLYLLRKPARPTLLDAFGPWPVYILVVAAIGFVCFRLLERPFRGELRSTE